MWESTRSKVKVLVAGVIVAAVVCCVVQLHVMEGDGPKLQVSKGEEFEVSARSTVQGPPTTVHQEEQLQDIRWEKPEASAVLKPSSVHSGLNHDNQKPATKLQNIRTEKPKTSTNSTVRIPPSVYSGLNHDNQKPLTKVTSEPSGIWKKRTFCHDFLVNTYHDGLRMCGSEVAQTDQVKCSGSVYANHMAVCSYENLAMRPEQMMGVIPNDFTWKKPASRTINLLQSREFSCPSASTNQLRKKADRDDFQVALTQHLLDSEKLSPSLCDTWINKTTLFQVSNALHIYFRFLDSYNVYKTLLDHKDKDLQVLRIGNMGKYLFPDFDKALFPGALTLDDLKDNGTVCFRKVIFVPRSYQSVLFRCKMDALLKKRCYECNGRGLKESPLNTFRTQVLKACNITDPVGKTRHLVIVSRKPYKRWSTDNLKKFQRVLQNEGEMVSRIEAAFPELNVTVIHMEDLDVCEQVRYAVESDVMVGVHGAGLVHFWWLRDNATALELEPASQKPNPSFKMLTTLTGKNYISERITGSSTSVRVNTNSLLSKLRQIL